MNETTKSDMIMIMHRLKRLIGSSYHRKRIDIIITDNAIMYVLRASGLPRITIIIGLIGICLSIIWRVLSASNAMARKLAQARGIV